MENFNTVLAELLMSDTEENHSKFYKELMNLRINIKELKNSDIISRLHTLYKKRILRKDLILYSLLVNEDKYLFENLIEHDNRMVKLDLENPTSLFDFTYVKKKHWFLEIIENEYPNIKDVFNEDILMRIYFIKLVYFSNLDRIDVDAIKRVLKQLNYLWEDKFVTTYVNELKRILNVIEYCTKTTKENCDITELYYYIWNNSVLNVLSKYVNLQDCNNWHDIKNLIKDEETFLKDNYNLKDEDEYSQSEIFLSFTILYNVIKCVKLCHDLKDDDTVTKSNISGVVEETKEMILQIEKETLLVELLEDIFVLVFMKNERNDDMELAEFFCNANELFLILLFLKSIINDITIVKRIDKQSTLYKRYKNLCDYVTDAFWRLELITTLEMDSEESSKKSILHYMLAPPESLICICLKKGNFEKANEVIQVNH